MSVAVPDRTPPLQAIGRNDWFNATAVSVSQHQDQVALINWNSREMLGRNQLTLPADADILRKVATSLTASRTH